MTGSSLRAALVAVLFCLALQPALAAPDPAAVGKAIADSVAATDDGTFAWKDVSANEAGDITFTDAVVTLANDRGTVSVAQLLLTGVVERAGGGFTAATLDANNGTAKSKSRTVTWKTAALTNITLPSPDEVKKRTPLRAFETAAVAGITYFRDDPAVAVTVDAVNATMGDPSGTVPADMSVTVTGIRVPAALVPNSVAAAMMSMLHYDAITASFAMSSSFDPADDSVTLNSLVVDAPDAGKLTIVGKISHVSPEKLADPKTASEARSDARLDRFSIRLDNAGVVERMLDMQAQMIGGTRDDVRNQLVQGALPFALAFVDNEAFRTQVLDAVTAFLDNPKSLTIEFSPSEPVPLGQAVKTAAKSPGSLPDLLSLTVQANN